MVLALRAETGENHGSGKRVAEQLDIGVESLRGWVKQHEIDHGGRPVTSTGDAERINNLEQEIRELRRANGILERASAFSAAELPPAEYEQAYHVPRATPTTWLESNNPSLQRTQGGSL
jgi:transposase-like protein